jgi:hypothetical protein
VWNARLALSFTVAGNALFHALHLESGHQGWTTTDIALTAVSAVPPIIVERFLHLQTKINVGVGVNTSGSATGIGNRPAATGSTPANRQASEETGKQQPTGNGRATDNPPAANNPADRQPSADKVPAAVKPETRQPAPSRRAVDGQPSTDTWVEIGKPVYDGLRAELGKRPGETVFHNTLAAHVAQLIADGALVGESGDEKPDAYADPSLSTAKRIRGEIEARFPGIIFGHHATDQHGDVTEEVA